MFELTARHGGTWSAPQRLLKHAADRLDRTAMNQLVQDTQGDLRAFTGGIVREQVERHNAAWPGGTRDGHLARRSGGFIRRIKQWSVEAIPGGWQSRITAPYYMAIHEKGGTIRPRTARYLTVPLPAALDSRGIPIERRARDWRDTFIFKSKKGNLIIAQRRGRGTQATIVPLYVLKKRVKIPPRMGMRRTIWAHRPELRSALTRRVNTALRGRA